MALQDRSNEPYVIVIVGDGALTSGPSYEAMNNIVHVKPKRLIVILNDNGWSISENVGWLAHWRNRFELHPTYQKFVDAGHSFFKRLPKGDMAWELARKLKSSVEGLFFPNLIWDELGFHYVGPVNGHDFKELEEALARAKDVSADGTPVVIHALTHKGRGFQQAEQNPSKFHQPGTPTGAGSAGTRYTYSQVFAKTLISMMEKDPKIVAFSAAMLEGTGLIEVQKKFPGRVFDVGIAEEHAVICAGGMAKEGWKPVVSIYSTFLQRSFDQLIHDVALQNLPVTICVDRAGLVGDDGKTHQGVFDISYTRMIPNMTIAAPKDENELQHVLFTAINSGRPFVVRYPRGLALGVELDAELKTVPIGKGEILREGRDLTFVAYGSMVSVASAAAEELEGRGPLGGRRQRPVRQASRHGPAREGRRFLPAPDDARGAPGGRGLRRRRARGLPRGEPADGRAQGPRDPGPVHRPQPPAPAAPQPQTRRRGRRREGLRALPGPRALLRGRGGRHRPAQQEGKVRRDGELVSVPGDLSGIRVEKLLIAGLRGFCAGVVRAIDVVEKALEAIDGPVYVRKEIIHNRYVVDELRDKGARFVEEVDEVPDNASLIFSAHGIAPQVRSLAQQKKLQTIDATCPLVTKVHLEAIHYAKQGYTIILVGHHDHDETVGTLGEAPDAIRLVETREDAEKVTVPDPDRVAYLTQTTLSIDDTRDILAVLKRRFPNLKAPSKQDICYATQNRQDAVKAMAPHVDMLLVLGAPNSSNSLRMCEVARANGVASHLIERARDIRPEWLQGVRTLGLTASASAPEILVQEVVTFAREKLGVTVVEEFETVKEDVHFPLPQELKALLPVRV